MEVRNLQIINKLRNRLKLKDSGLPVTMELITGVQPVVDVDKVLEEVQFFCDRSKIGTVFVFDDIWMYDHDAVEKLMSEYGFEVLEKGQVKASYIRLV